MNNLIDAIKNELTVLAQHAQNTNGYLKTKYSQGDFAEVATLANELRRIDAAAGAYRNVLVALEGGAGLGNEQPVPGAGGDSGPAIPPAEGGEEQGGRGGDSGADSGQEGIAEGART